MSESGPRSEPTGMVPRTNPPLSHFITAEDDLPTAVLVVVAGPARGEVIVVRDLPAVIGRSDRADLTIADDTVSRRHAELRGGRSDLEIEDLGSSNGTTLNGNDIAGPITLYDGDLLGLGSATFLVKTIV
jgi:pSer/pThr/pTyr-binding forkhead associated (FHA) protein